MYGGAPTGVRSRGPGRRSAVHLTDTGTELLVALGKFSGHRPDSGKVYQDEDDLWLVDQGAEPRRRSPGRRPTSTPGCGPRPGAHRRDEGDRIRVEGDRLVFEKPRGSSAAARLSPDAG